jgi:hypothetical protein
VSVGMRVCVWGWGWMCCAFGLPAHRWINARESGGIAYAVGENEGVVVSWTGGRGSRLQL